MGAYMLMDTNLTSLRRHHFPTQWNTHNRETTATQHKVGGADIADPAEALADGLGELAANILQGVDAQGRVR